MKDFTYKPKINKGSISRIEKTQQQDTSAQLRESRYELLYKDAALIQEKRTKKRQEELKSTSPFQPKLCEKSRIMAKKV